MFYKKRLIHAIGVICMLSLNSNAADESVRQPAVAGQFYPDRTDSLKSEVGFFYGKRSKTPSYPLMLISPHAGYVFSGPVAGKGYATIRKNIKTVILIGPSHHEWFGGLCITNVDYYQTPLGKVSLDKEIILKLRKSPLVALHTPGGRTGTLPGSASAVSSGGANFLFHRSHRHGKGRSRRGGGPHLPFRK